MAVWLAVSGGKNVGKTSVMEQILIKLRKRKLKVGTIKDSHLPIELDAPGTDTYRLRQAGADPVALRCKQGIFLFKKRVPWFPIPNSIALVLDEADVVLCEGFYNSKIPKIVIESSKKDKKTRFQPSDPIILKTRLQKDPNGIPKLPPEDLKEVISYIKSQLKDR
jgi:molybdopterin-guanine dinucleotide biosynthesis protein B